MPLCSLTNRKRNAVADGTMLLCATVLVIGWMPHVTAQLRPANGQTLRAAPLTAMDNRPVVYESRPAVSGTADPNVNQLLQPSFHLTVQRRRSQLVLTKRPVRRLAVTDSTICNYVQFGPTEIAVIGLQHGTTDLTIWFEGDSVPSVYAVTVESDRNAEQQQQMALSRLQLRLAELFPNSRVQLIGVAGQVVVQGQAWDADEARQILQICRSEVRRSTQLYGVRPAGSVGPSKARGVSHETDFIVNRLRIPGEFNIKMRVVIAEVSRTQLRELGVDWNVVFNDGRHGLGMSLGGATGTTISGIFENGQISVLLRWLAQNGTATLLAEPTIVCMSGHSASLLAGGEFAVPTVIGLGGGQDTYFRGIGTSMIVTPTVTDRDLIRLQIVPEFSAVDADSSVNGIPSTTVKRVQTTVELREGQTLALGGLISRQTQSEVNRIPLLSRVPFIGSRLFQSKNATEEEVELLVLVTPEIVRPMDSDEVPPLPNYYITHPSDSELLKYGHTEGVPDTTIYEAQPFGSEAAMDGHSGFGSPSVSGPVVHSHAQEYVAGAQSSRLPSKTTAAPIRRFPGSMFATQDIHTAQHTPRNAGHVRTTAFQRPEVRVPGRAAQANEPRPFRSLFQRSRDSSSRGTQAASRTVPR